VDLASQTLRNSVLVVGARALAKGAVFVVVVLLWNHLGDRDYGRFSTMVVYASLAGIVADLGLQTVFVRDVSRSPGELARYLGNLIGARLVLALLALLVLAAALRLLSPELFPFTVGGFALLITTSYASLLRAAFYTRGRLGFEAIAILGEAVVLLILTLAALARGAGWDVFLWVYASSYLFTGLFAYGVIRWRWQIRPGIRFQPRLLRGLLRAALPLALGFILTTMYAQVDVVLLQLFQGFQRVGWYVAANKYVDAVAWIPQSAMGAVFPALALLSAGDKARLAGAFQRSYKMLAVAGVPLAAGLVLLADPLVHATRGYPESIPALQVIGISVAFLFVNNAFIYTLTAMNRQDDFTWLALATLGLNLALNLVLIPLAGYLGASAASTLTEVGLFVGGWWMVRRQLPSLPVVRSVQGVVVSGGIMAAALVFLRSGPLVLAVPAAAAVYIGALLALGALAPQEWAAIRGAALGSSRPDR